MVYVFQARSLQSFLIGKTPITLTVLPLFCPHVEINIRKFVTVGSPCAAKFHAISVM